MPLKHPNWDIFCRVIDNYGDIGVCWRLAKQLAYEYDIHVRLFVDDLESTQHLLPSVNITLGVQYIDRVEIHHWRTDTTYASAGDVVIEAFGCNLPQDYLHSMEEKRPIWLNLEYLSAENWVEDYHLMPSPHPSLALTKLFYFPGFTTRTGGLIRERDLISDRDQFIDRQQQANTGHQLLQVSLFCYPFAPVSQLLSIMSAGAAPVYCYIPQTGIMPAVRDFFGIPQLTVGQQLISGNLTVEILPFLTQEAYDRLLWSCDINFVRGEDSWVRAIWAGRPFVWQPYHQEENTHLTKLEAFFDKYFDAYEASARNVIEQFHYAWIEGRLESPHWQRLLQFLPSLRTYTSKRSDVLAKMPDLASKLVILSENSQ